MIFRLFLSIVFIGFILGGAGTALAGLKYYPDPVYKKLNADDPHPMDDMIDLAKQGDVRAQYILGDMYSKGKGGFAQDLKEARHWFEESAIHGYEYSFIRLAALAKHEKKSVEAWQWYTLAIDSFDYGDQEQKFAIKARHDLVEEAKLSSEDVDRARGAIDDWKTARNKKLRAESEVAREGARQPDAAVVSENPTEKKEKTKQILQPEKKNEQD